MSKKPIIVFEGIEGSGKTHHISKVVKFLRKKKFKFIKIREPGGSKNSEKIRQLLMSNSSNFNKLTDLMLYMASRNENYINIISKNLNKKIILIDRFVDSTIAYQHYGMGIELDIINYLNKKILKNTKVNFTFLHTVSIRNLNLRLNRRKTLNRYDKFKRKFYMKAQNGFIKLAKSKKNYLLINSNKSIDINEDIVIKKIKQLLKKC